VSEKCLVDNPVMIGLLHHTKHTKHTYGLCIYIKKEPLALPYAYYVEWANNVTRRESNIKKKQQVQSDDAACSTRRLLLGLRSSTGSTEEKARSTMYKDLLTTY